MQKIYFEIRFPSSHINGLSNHGGKVLLDGCISIFLAMESDSILILVHESYSTDKLSKFALQVLVRGPFEFLVHETDQNFSVIRSDSLYRLRLGRGFLYLGRGLLLLTSSRLLILVIIIYITIITVIIISIIAVIIITYISTSYGIIYFTVCLWRYLLLYRHLHPLVVHFLLFFVADTLFSGFGLTLYIIYLYKKLSIY